MGRHSLNSRRLGNETACKARSSLASGGGSEAFVTAMSSLPLMARGEVFLPTGSPIPSSEVRLSSYARTMGLLDWRHLISPLFCSSDGNPLALKMNMRCLRLPCHSCSQWICLQILCVCTYLKMAESHLLYQALPQPHAHFPKTS